MQFNEYWTKEKNDELRQMNKEHKGYDKIVEHFGKDLLQFHPDRKFSHGNKLRAYAGFKTLNFKQFLNEIVVNPNAIDYKYEWKQSPYYPDHYDFIIQFSIGSHEYTILLLYYICKGIKSFNLIFTTKNQYDEYLQELNKILNRRQRNFVVQDDSHDKLAEILEKETNYNELHKVINAISFIMLDFYDDVLMKNYPNMLLSIGETKNIKKINLYRNVIKDSFKNKNITETEDVDEVGIKIYYYKIT